MLISLDCKGPAGQRHRCSLGQRRLAGDAGDAGRCWPMLLPRVVSGSALRLSRGKMEWSMLLFSVCVGCQVWLEMVKKAGVVGEEACSNVP